MRKANIALLVCMVYISANAQHKKNKINDNNEVPAKSWTLRWNMANLIDPIEPNLNFGVEYRVKNKFSVATDVGYIFFNTTAQQNITATSGILIKPSARYYPYEKQRFYVEGEFLIKLVHHKINDWLGQNCVNNIPAYETYKTFVVRKTALGFQAKIGRVGRLSKDNKLSFDWYIGVGLRQKKYKLINEPNACYDFSDIDILNGSAVNAPNLLPTMPLGFRLTYVL